MVVPDQIGYGRSSKPFIPYNLHDMARNTRLLLQSLKIDKAMVVGHSMGGMVRIDRELIPERLDMNRTGFLGECAAVVRVCSVQPAAYVSGRGHGPAPRRRHATAAVNASGGTSVGV